MHVLRRRGVGYRCQCLLDIVSGGASDHEGKENTNNVDIYAPPSATLVLVLRVQVMVTASQFHLRCDPAKAPGGISPTKSRSEFG